MINQFQKRILILAVRAGELMMKSGAEIYRVEDTITRICKAGRISYVDVFATPTGIFVTLDNGDRESDVFTYIRRIKGSNTDLSTISEVNKFSREFTTTDLSVDEGMKILSEIERKKPYPFSARLLGAALVAAFFCVIFGGDTVDFFIAAVIGAISCIISTLLGKIELNFFIKGFCCCFLATFLALLVTTLGLTEDFSSIIIGTLMIFVPGVAITNSIRDFLSGDMLSGVARLTEALVVGVSLAAGAGLMLELWSMLGGVI